MKNAGTRAPERRTTGIYESPMASHGTLNAFGVCLVAIVGTLLLLPRWKRLR